MVGSGPALSHWCVLRSRGSQHPRLELNMSDDLESLVAEHARQQERREALRAEIREFYNLVQKLKEAQGQLDLRRTYLKGTNSHVRHVKVNILTLTSLPKGDPLQEVPSDFITRLARDAVKDRPDREAALPEAHVDALTEQLDAKRAEFVHQLCATSSRRTRTST